MSTPQEITDGETWETLCEQYDLDPCETGEDELEAVISDVDIPGLFEALCTLHTEWKNQPSDHAQYAQDHGMHERI